MPAPRGNRHMLLRPISAVQPDGAQLFEVLDPDSEVWSASIAYPLGAAVQGSDGKVYISKVPSNQNHNPVGDSAVHWLNLW